MQRKAFRRSISIVLKPGKPVQVRVSMGTTLHAILQFLESREQWIEKHLKHFEETEKDLPKRHLEVGTWYPFLGRMLILKVGFTPLEKMFFSAEEDALILYLPKKWYRPDLKEVTFAHGALREFYRQSAEKHLKGRLLHWAGETGLRPRSMHLKEAKSRWGSCHPDGKVTLNWRLMVFRPEVVDYVIVHELCHLQEMNHSKRFWSLVEKFYPEMRSCVREIREQHRHADFLEKIPVLKPLSA
ncbi:MAG: M48 family metallopeptidase [Bdellovibrionaceae bacterium]|nr:M48 family metallopeptidase [Pseudobdellovibrionaceae bacterium]